MPSQPKKPHPPPQILKRKAPPNSTPSSSNPALKKQRRQFTTRDARAISSQATGNAFGNGTLDVDKFVKARDFEIKAIEDGMRRAKKGLTKRAFQGVPRDMRRRTASHDVKRVPKRLRARAEKEMVEDKTPAVDRKGKLNSKRRLRMDTVKKLMSLSARRSVEDGVKKKDSHNQTSQDQQATSQSASKKNTRIKTPCAKVNKLSQLPVPKARFRKRQIHKAWLPTHLFHAKRAHMTPPSAPLWRMAIPLAPTQKGYRSTHRASTNRGAVAWDMSYMSTIMLEGKEPHIITLLQSVGVGRDEGDEFWGRQGRKWIRGTRFWEGWMNDDDTGKMIASITIIWCAESDAADEALDKQGRRQAFVRVHPAAFFDVWGRILALAKAQGSQVTVQDLRFEIGSIEIMGPAAMEAFAAVLSSTTSTPTSKLLSLLATTTGPSQLPPNVLLPLSLSDPRLATRKKLDIPQAGLESADQRRQLLKALTDWPLDAAPTASMLFNRNVRLESCRQMPSQKSISRRRTLTPPGAEISRREADPIIPAILFAARSLSSGPGAGSYTLLLPWKWVLPFWYQLLHQPLSCGGTMRFGGLQERRQVAFENEAAWFPGDFPGTEAGTVWEARERSERMVAWKARPRGKRIAWESVDLEGEDGKGEIGIGWACDWEFLLRDSPSTQSAEDADGDIDMAAAEQGAKKPFSPQQLAQSSAHAMLKSRKCTPEQASGLATVKITSMTSGVPTTCARIYRLPSNPALRKEWLALLPASSKDKVKSGASHSSSIKTTRQELLDSAPLHVRRQHLAASLLSGPAATDQNAKEHPRVPGKEDLIGFVTTGNFNLGQGRGTAIGSIVLERVVDQRDNTDGRDEDLSLCIVRNAGQTVGRLARWRLV